MTKADLIEEVAQVTEVTHKDAQIIVDTLFKSVVDSLKSGNKVELRGFGSFRTRPRRGRIARNPKSGEKVTVPPKTIPYFKPSKALRDMVNDGPPPADPLNRED